MRLLLLICLALSTIAPLGTAQTSGSRTTQNSASMSFIPMDILPTDVYYNLRGRPIEVNGRPWSRTAPTPIDQGSELTLYRHFGQDSEQANIFAQTQLPSGTNRYLVFVGPASEGGAPFPWKLMALDDSTRAHPHNSVRILNLCQAPLACDIAGKKVLVPAGGIELVKLDSTSDRIEYKMAVQDPAKGWNVVEVSRRRNSPVLRTLLIARPAPEGKGRNGVIIETLRDQ